MWGYCVGARISGYDIDNVIEPRDSISFLKLMRSQNSKWVPGMVNSPVIPLPEMCDSMHNHRYCGEKICLTWKMNE